jgi:predicted ATP-binding protein involved in virulence
MRNDIVVNFFDGRSLVFGDLSDGQRALVGLVAEIARRACMLNFDFLGANTLTETPGLVLIDEIDLHLHPKWQRQIVGALKRIFPKIQFFATTHSPQVIGQARPEEIVMLTPDGRQERPSRSLGMDSNWVLECVMRAEGRDPATALKIKQMRQALQDSDFDRARILMEQLREEIGEDPSVAATDAYLWNLDVDHEEAAE